jgi:two-component system LytT family response regulator
MGTTYRCLIIDDETPAHKALISHISKFDDLEYSGSAYNGKEALRMLNENQYDIIFLDINMPLISGVELMELQPNRPLTIVTTAYTDFALSAYQNDAIDYLLKPISLEKFSKAVDKAKGYFMGYKIGKETDPKDRFLTCRLNGVINKIDLNEILYIDSIGNYMKVHTKKTKSPYVIYGTLAGIISDIGSQDFVQVHRSYIANVAMIKSINQNSITLVDSVEIPVGRKYKILLSNLKIT